jgi:outer membrane protein
MWVIHVGAADIAKIGVIDAQRILETSAAGKAAKAQIKEQSTTMAADLKEKGEEVEELARRLEREAMVMSQEKREDKKREYRIKLNDFKGLEQRYRNELKDLEKKLISRIQKDIMDISEEIGKKDGYLLIVNKLGVMYSPKSVDITDSVIEIYNARYVKGSAEAAKKD